jgi:hypothetical protein
MGRVYQVISTGGASRISSDIEKNDVTAIYGSQALVDRATGEELRWCDLYRSLKVVGENQEDLSDGLTFEFENYSQSGKTERNAHVFLPACVFSLWLKENGCPKASRINIKHNQSQVDGVALQSFLSNYLRFFLEMNCLTVSIDGREIGFSTAEIPKKFIPIFPIVSEKFYRQFFEMSAGSVFGSTRKLFINGLHYCDVCEEQTQELFSRFDNSISDNLTWSLSSAIKTLRVVRDKEHKTFDDFFDVVCDALSDEDFALLQARYQVLFHSKNTNFFEMSKRILASLLISEITENKIEAFVQKESFIQVPDSYEGTSLMMISLVLIAIEYLHEKRKIDNKAKERLEQIFDELLYNRPVYFLVLVCCLYNCYRSRKKGLQFSDSLDRDFIEYYERTEVYYSGIKEVLENILHSTERLGAVYIRVHDEGTTSQGKDWLEIGVLDISGKGILENRDYLILESEDDVIEELRAYYDIDAIKTLDLNDNNLENDHDIQNLLFNKGLKIFKNNVIGSKGYFCVKTTHGECSETLIYFSKTGSERHAESKNQFPGTEYNIWLPLNNEATAPYFNSLKAKLERLKFRKTAMGEGTFEQMANVLSGEFQYEFVELPAVAVDEVGHSNRTSIVRGYLKRANREFREIGCECRAVLVDMQKLPQSLHAFGLDSKLMMYFFILLSDIVDHLLYVAFFNVSDELIAGFVNGYTPIVKSIVGLSKSQAMIPWLYLYDKNGDPIIITDMDVSACAANNELYYSQRSYHNARTHQKAFNVEPAVEPAASFSLSDDQREEKLKHLLFPLEVLGRPSSKALEAPIFENHLYKLLESEVEGEKFGVLQKVHVRLGNKIHISKFYQAELLFESDYYSDSFAFIVASNILKKLAVAREKAKSEQNIKNIEAIRLYCYQGYSAPLIDKIEKLLKTRTDIIPKILPRIMLAEDKANESQQINGGFHRTNEPAAESGVSSILHIIIVPISTTLKTFTKIIAGTPGLSDSLKSEENPYNPLLYSLFELSDKHEILKDDGKFEPTAIEKVYGWKDIEEDFRTITFMGDWPNEMQYSMCYLLRKETKWQNAGDCQKCEAGNQLLFDTKNDSLSLLKHNGIPYNDRFLQKNDNSFIRKRAIMAKRTIKGHFARGVSHFEYYLDTEGLFRDFVQDEELVDEFKKRISSAIIESNKSKTFVLIVPRHITNLQFVDWVRDKVFNGLVVIVRENFHSEFPSDFVHKYKFLKNAENLEFIFIDDSLNTGQTYIKASSFVSLLVNGLSAENGIELVHPKIIALVNRLDSHNWRLLQRIVRDREIVSAFDFFAPMIFEQAGECWLCAEEERASRLHNHSRHIWSQEEFKKKIEHRGLKRRDINGDLSLKDQIEDYDDNRDYENIRNQLNECIFQTLFDLNEDAAWAAQDEGRLRVLRERLGLSTNYDIEKNIITQVELGSFGFSYKVSFLKLLVAPFLGSFQSISEIAHRTLCREFEKMLNRKEIAPVPTSNPTLMDEAIDETYPLLYLKTIVERLALHHSLSVVKISQVEKIWECAKSLAFDRDSLLCFAKDYSASLKRMMSEDRMRSLQIMKELMGYSDEMLRTPETGTGDSLFNDFVESILLEDEHIIGHAVKSYNQDKHRYKAIDKNVLRNYYYQQYQELCEALSVSNPFELVKQLSDEWFSNCTREDDKDSIECNKLAIIKKLRKILGYIKETEWKISVAKCECNDDNDKVSSIWIIGKQGTRSEVIAVKELNELAGIVLTDSSDIENEQIEYQYICCELKINFDRPLILSSNGTLIMCFAPAGQKQGLFVMAKDDAPSTNSEVEGKGALAVAAYKFLASKCEELLSGFDALAKNAIGEAYIQTEAEEGTRELTTTIEERQKK